MSEVAALVRVTGLPELFVRVKLLVVKPFSGGFNEIINPLVEGVLTVIVSGTAADAEGRVGEGDGSEDEDSEEDSAGGETAVEVEGAAAEGRVAEGSETEGIGELAVLEERCLITDRLAMIKYISLLTWYW